MANRFFSVSFVCAALLLGAFFLSFPAQAQKRAEGIVAVVNTQAITQSDVNDRMKLILTSAGLPSVPDVVAKVRPQVVNSLIEEAIKTQEADRLKISIPPEDIEAALATIAQQNKMSADQFKGMLQAQKINLATLQDQIRAQLSWMKVVTRQIRSKIEVSDTDIDAELSDLKSRIGQTEYLLSEIVLPIDGPQDEKAARSLADRLMSEIRSEPKSFPALAQQFSKSAGAQQGGLIGWVSAGQLPMEIGAALKEAKKDDLVGPVKTLSGLHLLLVRDVRSIQESTLPSREAVLNRIGTERLDRQQRRYFLDLKSSSYIEIRS